MCLSGGYRSVQSGTRNRALEIMFRHDCVKWIEVEDRRGEEEEMRERDDDATGDATSR